MDDTMHGTDDGSALAPEPVGMTTPDPGGTEMPAADETPEPALEPEARTSRVLGRILLSLAILLVVGTLVVGFLGMNAKSAADDEQARVASLVKEQRALEQDRQAAVRERTELTDRADAVLAAVDTLNAAFDTSLDAQHRFTDSVNHGADVWNAGDTAGAEAIYRDDAGAALAELTQRQTELRAALSALHDARADLEEALP